MASSHDGSIRDFDQRYLWHPYTQSRSDDIVHPVASAHGCCIKLADGRELVDGMASWWSAIHGYNHPTLNQALTEQLADMAHIMFGGLTHSPAVALGQRLHQLLPQALERIFYCDSGSVAVEVAIKMAIQYQRAKGAPQRHRFIALRNAYHGDTYGAMSLCDPVNGMHHLFQGILPQQIFVSAPRCSDQCDDDAVQELEQCLQEHSSEVAALVLEPVVQGAGGMRIYHPQYLSHARQLCDRYGVLLILDEIATGFGRTGKMFGFEHVDDCVPDIICLGKALTGGYLSFATTVTTAAVADSIDSDDPGALMHGPTYMANPLACAVACASIDLLGSGEWQQNVARIEQHLRECLPALQDLPSVKDVRIKGAIGVIELSQDAAPDLCQRFVERGVWIRPFRNLVYIMPAYTISNTQLAQLSDAMCEVMQQYTNE